ncbi:ABC transporter ATP-binding protein [Aminobacter aminovorans]|uniref:ABC transporter ATP-binding protein n=1 Tax=Aminobacter TaxID=31988 RepID=UPI002861DE47|nr:ABC transporter ATP-binding protein [Aminobacter aminovorans]MDR7225172.1 iron(III) transport system ATP-binding protein [Aminobacter aminovorans]
MNVIDTTLRGETRARIQGRGLSKKYVTKNGITHALNDVSIDIHPGEMVVLLGPSGCGKTTLLRSIAGLEQPQDGEISINGDIVYSAARRHWVPPELRGVSMVFQSYALWPHMSVIENISFPLRSRRVEKARAHKRAGEVMEAVGLSGMGDRLPSQLSGGQQQRVALARAIAAESHVVLFDEPLSNVDAKVRDQIRREIVSLQRQLGFAGLYVTHDQLEAGALADTLVVMDHGKVVQIGPPSKVYDAPNNRYVANFMGPSNETKGKVVEAKDLVTANTPWGVVSGTLRSGKVSAGDTVEVMLRPESCRLSREPVDRPNAWQCTIERQTFMGAFVELQLDVAGPEGAFQLFALAPKYSFSEGEIAWIKVAPQAMWVFA